MDAMPIKAAILNAMPEATLLIYLGLNLIGIRPDKRRVIIAGIIQGFICCYVRRNFDFGIHIFLQYSSFVLLTWIVVKVPILAATIANSITYILAVLLESLSGVIIPYITGITVVEIMTREWLRISLFLPYLAVLVGITYLVDKYQFTLEQEIKLLKRINREIKG